MEVYSAKQRKTKEETGWYIYQKYVGGRESRFSYKLREESITDLTLNYYVKK